MKISTPRNLIPPFWAKDGHTQTLAGYFLPSPPVPTSGEEVQIQLEDSETLVGRYFEGKDQVLVYLFHGLGGDISSNYIQRTAQVMLRKGHHVLCVNHRGCGEGAGKAKKPYHSGKGEDLCEVIQYGRDRFPNHQHIAIGFSLSGSALLNLITGRRGNTQPDGAITVNAPLNLEKCGQLLTRGLNRLYDLKFVHLMRSAIQQKKEAGLLPKEKYNISPTVNLTDIDNLYLAQEAEFYNREDYYHQCSALPYLEQVEVPHILMTAKDDPFIDYRDYVQAKLSDFTHLHIEENGGHLGFLCENKPYLGTLRWMDYSLDHFTKELLQI